MPIKYLLFRHRPPLSPCDVVCDERVNLFIGPNASGKSTALRAIDVCYSKMEYESGDYENAPDEVILRHPSWGVYVGVSYDWAKPTPNFMPPARQWMVPLFYVPATRVNLPPPGGSPGTIDRSGAFGVYDPNLYPPAVYNPHLYYGNVEESPIFHDPEQVEAKSVFYGNRVEQALATAREFQARRKEDQILRVIRTGFACVRKICREVIYDDVPHPFVELQSEEPSSRPGTALHFDMGILTTDDALGEPLYAGALSSGTQGTLLWIWAMALHMAHHYGFAEGWENKPAVLLIDEIENHLHPTWQRRVIPALLEQFPNLQIFASTHSPFVVAGLKAGQVHLLDRNARGEVAVSTNERDVVGWTADEITRAMMGVADPTDEATAKAAAELRELRRELPRADESEEEERQHRIQELRLRVDRDLLAGGPMAAQRELFELNLAEILEEHRRTWNLSQE